MNKAFMCNVVNEPGKGWHVVGHGLDNFENGASVIVTKIDTISELVEDDVTICEGCDKLCKYNEMYGDEEGYMFCEDCWNAMLDDAIAYIELGDDE